MSTLNQEYHNRHNVQDIIVIFIHKMTAVKNFVREVEFLRRRLKLFAMSYEINVVFI